MKIEDVITQVQRENTVQSETIKTTRKRSSQAIRKVKKRSTLQESVQSTRPEVSSLLCCCCLRLRRRQSQSCFKPNPNGIKPQHEEETNSNEPSTKKPAVTSTVLIPSEDEQKKKSEITFLLPLPEIPPDGKLKILMVIDLDETLVHSSFKPINNPDFIVPVDLGARVYQVHVLKRPFVDQFLQRMGELYECVLFTASVSKYADPVTDILDKWGVFKARLYRDSCVNRNGSFVKDLSRLGRDLTRTIIFDNAPVSYLLQPDNAVPATSWFDDAKDTELLHLIPFFERLATVDDVYSVLRNNFRPFTIPKHGEGDSFEMMRFNQHKKLLPSII